MGREFGSLPRSDEYQISASDMSRTGMAASAARTLLGRRAGDNVVLIDYELLDDLELLVSRTRTAKGLDRSAVIPPLKDQHPVWLDQVCRQGEI